MSGKRDLVRLLPNERVDLGDWDAMQRNQRSDVRSTILSLLYGQTTTAANMRKVVAGFTVAEDSGGASALIEITSGAASGAEVLPDNSLEYGVMFGREVQTLQTLDFTGQPNNTYGVYVRFSTTLSDLGTRVFWNANTTQEDLDVIETRYVADWDVQYATSSPGNEWVLIASVVWAGATVVNADITDNRFLFFEGDAAAAPAFDQEWGDGANDRDTDRSTYGVGSLFRWVQLVRRQLTDILGSTSKHYSTVPWTLAEGATHVATTSNPHGSSLTQTDLNVTGILETDGSSTLKGLNAAALEESGAGTDPPSVAFTIGPASILGGYDFNATYNTGVDLLLNADFPTASGKLGISSLSDNAAGVVRSYVDLTPWLAGAPSGAGCVMEAIAIDYYHDTTTNDLDLVVSLIQVAKGSGGRTTLDTITVSPSAIGAATASAAWSGALDTTNNWYQLEVEWDDTSAAPGGALAVYGIQIQYQRARLFGS